MIDRLVPPDPEHSGQRRDKRRERDGDRAGRPDGGRDAFGRRYRLGEDRGSDDFDRPPRDDFGRSRENRRDDDLGRWDGGRDDLGRRDRGRADRGELDDRRERAREDRSRDDAGRSSEAWEDRDGGELWRPERLWQERSRGDAGRPKPARDDLGRSDPLRDDLGRSERGRGDVGRSDPPREDLGRSDRVRSDIGRTDPLRDDLGRSERGRGETGRPDPLHDDLGRSERVRSDIGRSDPLRDDLGRSERVRSDVGRPDPLRDDLGRSERVRGDIGRPDPLRGDLGRSERGRSDVGRTDPLRDLGRTDRLRDDPGRAGRESDRGDVSRRDPLRSDLGRSPERVRDDSARGDLGRSDPLRGDLGRSERAREDRPYGDLGRSDPVRDVPRRPEPTRDDRIRDDVSRRAPTRDRDVERIRDDLVPDDLDRPERVRDDLVRDDLDAPKRERVREERVRENLGRSERRRDDPARDDLEAPKRERVREERVRDDLDRPERRRDDLVRDDLEAPKRERDAPRGDLGRERVRDDRSRSERSHDDRGRLERVGVADRVGGGDFARRGDRGRGGRGGGGGGRGGDGRGGYPRDEGPRRRKRGGGGFWLYLFGGAFSLMLVGGMAAVAVAAVYVVRVSEGLPAIEDLAEYEPPVMSRVQAGDGRLIAEYYRESRVFVPIETIPPQVIQAFLSAEDKNFYQHGGVDPIGMARAGIRNIIGHLRGDTGPLEGGSTITQQVAKNFKLEATQTMERKVREIVLARRIEEAFTKDEILELYLNEIYLGRQAYGVAAAALNYFGKPLNELRLSEIAYLAAVPRAPNNYHPVRNKDRAIARRNWVLDRMVANGVLDATEAEIAKRDDLVVSDRLTGATYQAVEYFVEEVRRFAFSTYGDEELYEGGLSIRTTLDTRLQVAARRALRDGLEAYDRRHGYRGPIGRIEVGEGWQERLINLETESIDIDPTWAKAVVLRVNNEQARIGFLDGSEGVIPLEQLTWARRVDENGRMGPEITAASAALSPGEVIYAAPLGPDPETGNARENQFSLRQIPAVNGAIMAIDPHTGRVLALQGGYSFRLSQFDRATQARRQPGSSFKPFVYAAALDHGYTPVSLILDAPYVAPAGEDGAFYKPTNYVNRWYGETTLRRGIELSRNLMTVRLANAIGLDLVSEYGERFGIYDDLAPYVSMALGAGETTLWNMVSGYARLVNGGYEITPTIIDRVQDRDGVTIYRHDARICTGCDVNPDEIDWNAAPTPKLTDPRARVIDPVTAYQMVSILEGVVERGTAQSSVGTLDRPLAGKTGTTNDYKDAWFVGFSPDLVAGVYIGFDTPRSLGQGESGGVVAAPVFRDFMAAALENEPKIPFRTPPGVRLVAVNSETGELARQGDPGAILEAFRPGTEPTRYSSTGAAGSSGVERGRGGISIAGPGEVAESPRAPLRDERRAGPSNFDLPPAGGAARAPATGAPPVTAAPPPVGGPFPGDGAEAASPPADSGLGALLDQLEARTTPYGGAPPVGEREEDDNDSLGGLY